MDAISLEDLALLDVLHRIDQGVELVHGDGAIRQRMVESGLIERLKACAPSSDL